VAGVALVVEPVPVLAGVLVAAVVVAGVLAAGVLAVDFDFELLDPHAASSSAVAATGTIALSRGRYWFNVASPCGCARRHGWAPQCISRLPLMVIAPSSRPRHCGL
jgi:hypothetical protein